MDAAPKAPKAPSPSPEPLEDRVYRASLAEAAPALRRASPWRAAPIAAAVLALIAVPVLLLARPGAAPAGPVPSMAVLLQEGPKPAVRAGGPAPAAAPAPRAPSAAPAPAPPPEVPPKAAPPAPEMVPEQTPRELPKADHARQGGGGADVATGSGSGNGTGGGGESPGGTGGGNGMGADSIQDVVLTKGQIKYQPPAPPYPPVPHSAGIQGDVVVEVVAGTDGVPISAQAKTGPYQLRGAAVAYALTWRFHPRMENGVPRVCRFSITVQYRITN